MPDTYISFFLSLSFWGIASLSVVYAKGFAGLLVLRILLGIGEAVLIPIDDDRFLTEWFMVRDSILG